MAYVLKPKKKLQSGATAISDCKPLPATVQFYDFAEKTYINWFRIYFSNDEKRQFYVNPWIIGAMSPVLETMFLNEKFIEARDGEVCLPTENPEDVLDFLQSTVPHGCNPCKPISAASFPILLHYAKIWMIDDLEAQCRRFVRGEFRNTATTLDDSLAMLEAACDNKIQDSTTLAVLIGRSAAFGSEALINAGVLDSHKLTAYASGLLFMYGERKAQTTGRGGYGTAKNGRAQLLHRWQSGAPGGRCALCSRQHASLEMCASCTVVMCSRCAQQQSRTSTECSKTIEIIPIAECETEESKSESQAAARSQMQRQRSNHGYFEAHGINVETGNCVALDGFYESDQD